MTKQRLYAGTGKASSAWDRKVKPEPCCYLEKSSGGLRIVVHVSPIIYCKPEHLHHVLSGSPMGPSRV